MEISLDWNLFLITLLLSTTGRIAFFILWIDCFRTWSFDRICSLKIGSLKTSLEGFNLKPIILLESLRKKPNSNTLNNAVSDVQTLQILKFGPQSDLFLDKSFMIKLFRYCQSALDPAKACTLIRSAWEHHWVGLITSVLQLEWIQLRRTRAISLADVRSSTSDESYDTSNDTICIKRYFECSPLNSNLLHVVDAFESRPWLFVHWITRCLQIVSHLWKILHDHLKITLFITLIFFEKHVSYTTIIIIVKNHPPIWVDVQSGSSNQLIHIKPKLARVYLPEFGQAETKRNKPHCVVHTTNLVDQIINWRL